MLSRKVITRRGRRFRGYFPSQKLGRMVAWESLLERDAIYLLEFSPGVVSYREQPTVIQYFDGDRMRDYYPDFELILNDGSVIHLEVKPSSELAKPKIRAKLQAIACHYVHREGRNFRLVTERDIRRQPLLTNLNTLLYVRNRTGHLLPSIAELTRLFGSTAVHLGDVRAKFGEEAALRLLAAGHIICDLTMSLTADAVVTVTKGEQHATVLL